MESHEASSQALVEVSMAGRTNESLHGAWLVAVRFAWMIIALACLAIFFASIPAYLTVLQQVCSGSADTVNTCYINNQLSQANVQTLVQSHISLEDYAIVVVIIDIVSSLTFILTGALIFWRKSNERFSLFVSLVLILFGTLGPGELNRTMLLITLYPTWQVALPVRLFQLSIYPALGLFFYLFPTGRLVPRWSWIFLFAWIAQVIFYALPVNSPYYIQNLSPFLRLTIYLLAYGSAVSCQIYRYRRVSRPAQRQQTKWLIFGFVCTIVLRITSFAPFDPNTFSPLLLLFGILILYLSWLPLPLAVGIAILRYRLWDIDLLINRSLVYGILTVCVVGTYITLVVGLGTLFHSSENLFLSLLATALIAVLFQPLRAWVQRRVNRLIYGERDVPYQVISRLGQRLEATLEPSAILPMIVETVGLALKLPYAAIRIQSDGESVFMASYGKAKERSLSLPLSYAGEKMGELVLASRPGEEVFAPADLDLLTTLARQAGVAVHAVLLTTALERSRQRIVAAREEGRRRLGSDLHDGLGHQLTGLLLKTEFAISSLPEDQETLRVLLNELHAQIKTSVDEVRSVAHRLHPPELDLFGLTQAIQETAGQYQGIGKDGMRVQVHIPHKLDSVPLAVEVAAYYIVGEALTNASRHASASICRLSLQLLESSMPVQKFLGGDNTRLLEVEICDDGRGLVGEKGVHQVGLGILSMRERASELGGTCIIEQVSTGGTRVYAQIPCPSIA